MTVEKHKRGRWMAHCVGAMPAAYSPVGYSLLPRVATEFVFVVLSGLALLRTNLPPAALSALRRTAILSIRFRSAELLSNALVASGE